MDEEKKYDVYKSIEERFEEGRKNWRPIFGPLEEVEELTKWDVDDIPASIYEENIKKAINTLATIINDPHCPEDVKEHIKKSLEDIKNNPEKYREKFEYIL